MHILTANVRFACKKTKPSLLLSLIDDTTCALSSKRDAQAFVRQNRIWKHLLRLLQEYSFVFIARREMSQQQLSHFSRPRNLRRLACSGMADKARAFYHIFGKGSFVIKQVYTFEGFAK